MSLPKYLSSVGIIPVIVMVALVGLVVTGQANAHDDGVGGGVLHSCVNSNSSELKLVDADTNCKKNEDSIDWNAQGIQGDTGATGPSGPTGPQGDLGPVRANRSSG